MGAFYIDILVCVYSHPDRVETYQLSYGFRDGFALDGCRYMEILQFIVHKIDAVLFRLFIELLQCLGKGYVLKNETDVLRLKNGREEKEDKNKSVHDYFTMMWLFSSWRSICSKLLRFSMTCSRLYLFFHTK